MSRPVGCPICRKTFLPELSEAMPFCSLRCKQIDAQRWLDEKYTLPGDLEDEPEADAPFPQSPDDEA
jgi:endogenous inhibitor of DNA gyrase (YacG/DUF329 family)